MRQRMGDKHRARRRQTEEERLWEQEREREPEQRGERESKSGFSFRLRKRGVAAPPVHCERAVQRAKRPALPLTCRQTERGIHSETRQLLPCWPHAEAAGFTSAGFFSHAFDNDARLKHGEVLWMFVISSSIVSRRHPDLLPEARQSFHANSCQSRCAVVTKSRFRHLFVRCAGEAHAAMGDRSEDLQEDGAAAATEAGAAGTGAR
eukprot:2448481-Pleurochrysis_carterae.AAC.1